MRRSDVSESAVQERRTEDKARTAPHPDDPRKPRNPQDLRKQGWWVALKRAWAEFMDDGCMDLAAALTYHGIMAIFPAFLGLTALLGVMGRGPETTNALLDVVRDMGGGSIIDPLAEILNSVQQSKAAGFALAFSILASLWSASNFVNAFSRAMNKVYDVEEGRPFWKMRPAMLGVTILLVLVAMLVALSLVLSGSIAQAVGDQIGLGSTAVTIWNIAKWPVLALLVILAIDVLYYFTPNVKQPKFRWISPGAILAFLVWAIASAGFGFYVANFGSYNKTYGAMAGIIIFLLWLWLSCVVLLLGAEFDAEIERSRELQAGMPAEEALQLPPRDTGGLEKKATKRAEQVAEARRFRIESMRAKTPESGPQESKITHTR